MRGSSPRMTGFVLVAVPVLRSITPKSGVLHRARDTKGYLPRSFSSMSAEAKPSAGVPIEA
jgi:hypothetical protein